MYVLMVTFYKTVQPSLAPATIDACFEARTVFEDLPVAVSHDSDALRKEAESIRERFSATYYSHQIIEVKEV